MTTDLTYAQRDMIVRWLWAIIWPGHCRPGRVPRLTTDEEDAEFFLHVKVKGMMIWKALEPRA
jgi:hypothetical protein